jgi:phosphatidylserine/phosphatidylglycerophosphate/cardiolipin synthase-like enzyme
MSLTTPADFIVSVRAHDIDPIVFCTHLIHTAAASGGTVTPAQTAEEFNIHNEAADHLHDLASEFGLVEYTSPTTNQITVSQSTVTGFIQFLTYFEEYATSAEIDLLADDGIHDVELAVAVPDAFENRSAELMARLVRFVRNAESELLVVTPFFTRFGVDTFVDHLAQATNRGVEVTILTRDITDQDDNAEHVSRIYDTIAETGNLRNLNLFEYNSQHGRLHAKALVSDRDRAYVGSANFTNYSLKKAIEIGLIVHGPVVDDLAEFFAIVQRSPDTEKLDKTSFSP